MSGESSGEGDERPPPQTLMAAVIRLMAVCSNSHDSMQIRTLLSLLRELRAHPDLLRQPAVLAGLATANAIWVERLTHLGEATAVAAAADSADHSHHQIH